MKSGTWEAVHGDDREAILFHEAVQHGEKAAAGAHRLPLLASLPVFHRVRYTRPAAHCENSVRRAGPLRRPRRNAILSI